ncbi:uncharacterized protein LOC141537179 [Cotesia typhae]|uniref:uncharacterized protein LOC141537179 n=1 Tax=Cotesia typhae TaxID=2053667 RepID=UPI003D69A434
MNFDAKTIDSGNSQIEKCLHQNHNLFKKPVGDLIFQLIKNILGKKSCSAISVHTAETVVSQDIELNSIENINESNTTIINDANSINDNVDNNLIKSHSNEDLNDMVLEDIKTIHGVVQQNLEGLTENDKTDLETFPQHLNSAKITPTPNFSMQSDVITITKKDHKYFDDETKESYNTLEDIHKKPCIEKHHVQQFDTDNVKLLLNTTEAAKSLIQSFVGEEKNAKITNVVSNDCKSEKFVEEKSSEINFDIVFEAECNLIDQTKSSSLQFDLCQEDKLIELAIIGYRDMEDLSNDDDDLSGYQASYEA